MTITNVLLVLKLRTIFGIQVRFHTNKAILTKEKGVIVTAKSSENLHKIVIKIDTYIANANQCESSTLLWYQTLLHAGLSSTHKLVKSNQLPDVNTKSQIGCCGIYFEEAVWRNVQQQ